MNPEELALQKARLELRMLQLKAQEASQRDFLSFVKYMWPEAILGEHHKKMANAFDRIASGKLKRLIVNMPPRHRLSLDTPIATVDGWKTMATIMEGDQVFAPSGAPVLVTGKSDIYEEDLYEVTTSDGQLVVCDGEHLWTVRLGAGRPYRTYSTKELLHRLETENWRRSGNLPMLPPQGPAQFPYRELPIDPYVLGVWLGDGNSWSASIGSSFADMAQMRRQIGECGYETTFNPKYQQFNVLELHQQLREMGLLKNKHIPDVYLCASVEQRKALLQGLIDSDGDVTVAGKVTFNQTNRALMEQVLCLVHSLGLKARMTSRESHYKGKPGKLRYRLMFKMAGAARLPRKAVRCRDMQGNRGRSIDIRKTGRRGLVQCLEVANADGLFMAGRGFVVTHNTKSEFASYLLPAYIMGREPRTKIIQATHTGELAVRFGRKVRNLMDTDKYKEVFEGVTLSADSKAAGRWDTGHGGEYFACLTEDTPVVTQAGVKQAGEVRIGERLLNVGGWVRVEGKYLSEHEATVSVGGMRCSMDHPVWTMNRGWVYAGQLDTDDLLCVESIWERMKASTRRLYGTVEYAVVQALVQHQVAMQQSPQREVGRLRRAWDCVVRTLAGVRELLGGHGRAAYPLSYRGEDGQRRAVQSGELSLGDTAAAGQQPPHYSVAGGDDTGAAGQTPWDYAGGGEVSDVSRPRAFVPTQAQEEELRAYGAPTGIGGGRRATAWLLERSGQGVWQPGGSAEGNLARVAKATQKLCGLLLGVRRAGDLRIERHGPRDFVNFLTDGDHCFFAGGVLTHNCGVGGAMTGRGADLLIIDDPHSEQDAMSDLAMENAWEWYTSGPRQRLQPGGAIVVVMTRWNTKDLTARLLKAQSSHRADQWEVIEFPALLPSGKPLWPGFWKQSELLAVKASLSAQKWQAQWQQQPTNDEGAILKREWWQVWQEEEPPPVNYIIQSYDTAYSKKETADFSVITTWGVFYPDQDSGPNIILLDVKRGRWDFPELKRIAKEEYLHWRPDNVLIEAKATGTTLQQELRRVGIPVTMYSPGGRRVGQDKVSRAHAAAPMLESGMVWAPDMDWAEELVEECAAFPNGDHDDMVDSTTQALLRFRAGNFITLKSDWEDEKSEVDLVPEYY